MTSISDRRHWLAAAACAALALAPAARAASDTPAAASVAPAASTAPAASAIPAALPFDENTWQHLLAQAPRPAAYLFTTTYCATCPAAFAQLKAHTQAHASAGAELALILMNADAHEARRHARHYPGLTRLYIFDGFEPAIRQHIDPQWPNVTPYIVLIDKTGATQRGIGAPEPQMLKQWLP